MIKEHTSVFKRLLVTFDAGVIAVSFFLAYVLSVSRDLFTITEPYLRVLFFILCSWIYLLQRGGLYYSFRTKEILDSIYIIFKSAFLGLLIFSGIIYFFKIEFISRDFLAFVFIISTTLLCLEKIALIRIVRSVRRKGYNYRQILIVGTNKRAEKLITLINENAEWGLRIIGIVDFDKTRVGQKIKDVPIIGSTDHMATILHNNVVDEVVIISPRSWLEKVKDLIFLCTTEGIKVNLAADFFDLQFARAKPTDLQGFPLLTFETTSGKIWHLVFKRLLDITVSLAGLIILSPVFIIIAILIKTTSKGPIFFKQVRSGLNGRKFNLYKFRTMVVGAEEKLKDLLTHNEMAGPVFKMKNDPRITPIGGFLRKLSIDELPQLWNVLHGDMSLVGPRPPLPEEVSKYDNWHRRRLSMRPGITCLWQVNGRNKITNFDEWMKLDLEYIDNWSLVLDYKIMAKTVPVVLFGIGAK